MGLQSPVGRTYQETDLLREGGANPAHGSDRGLRGQPCSGSPAQVVFTDGKIRFYHFVKCCCRMGNRRGTELIDSLYINKGDLFHRLTLLGSPAAGVSTACSVPETGWQRSQSDVESPGTPGAQLGFLSVRNGGSGSGGGS